MPASAISRLGGNVSAPYTLAQSAVPVCLAPNGTVATNGTIALGTALPVIYSGGIWLRLPAGAVVGGSAGLYWAVMSSTTAGQVYTNFSDPANEFIPFIPADTLVAATGSNSAYTQSTAAITLATVNLAAGTLGLNGALRASHLLSTINNANTKTGSMKIGGSNFVGASFTTSASYRDIREVQNRGTANQQIVFAPTTGAGTSATAITQIAVDTAAAQQITFVGQLVTAATDFIVLERFCFEVIP